ncbi:antibiotic biosynthesis monooxygenase family protein [Neptunomonas concharum]|uniref:Antibiotic biosynthesis monooxygenase n=1 Tax=Neptunomonas concharum TaxID=1031538 RepID=A0A5P1RBW9_9GAMM|nr:antibiotic biosynthesis monooxygenase [Neptunomonas concharum]QEQ97149.1 antibiotic biosynthesis monooxygenase [Neptunomonas concharum]
MIKVIIERHIAEDLTELYEKAARVTLQKAMQAHGFISGEALKNAYDPNHRIVIATYRTVQDWHRWLSSEERKEVMEQIIPMLDRDEKFTVLEH